MYLGFVFGTVDSPEQNEADCRGEVPVINIIQTLFEDDDDDDDEGR